MAGILLKRRKTHNQSINQSNELIFTAQVINADIYFLVYIKPISACVLVFSHSQSNQQCLSLKMVISHGNALTSEDQVYPYLHYIPEILYGFA